MKELLLKIQEDPRRSNPSHAGHPLFRPGCANVLRWDFICHRDVGFGLQGSVKCSV